MPWSKMKNIIIFILAITNLCLFALALNQAAQNRHVKDQLREETFRYLLNRGVQVDEALVPQSMELLPQVVERDMEGEAAAARALLQGEVQSEARGGEVYRYYNDLGSVQFHSDGTFSARLDPAAFPLGENAAESCLALLEQLSFQGELVSEEGNELTFRQTWQGFPLFQQQVTLVLEGTGVAAMTAGHRLVGEPEVDSSRTVVTVATALVDLMNGVNTLGDVCNRIDGIEQGYVTASSLSGRMILTPVWRVTTDTGTYQLDTVTGTVTRVV